jgi:hypothetical protein
MYEMSSLMIGQMDVRPCGEEPRGSSMNVRLTAKKVEIGYVDEVHVLKVNGMSLDLKSSFQERMA